MGTNGVRLSGTDSILLVSGGGNNDPALGVDGVCGVARLDHGQLSSYTLQHGHNLALGREPLVKAELLSKEWAPYFDSAVTVAASLKDKRATIGVAENPMHAFLIIKPPRIDPGKPDEIPLKVSVTFRMDAKPKRIVTLRSDSKMPQLDDPEAERKSTAWPRDYHAPTYKRKTLDFTWDETTKCATVQLDTGITQIVWE